MSKTIKTRKGLDIKLVGEANKTIVDIPLSSTYTLSPLDFHGLTPKMLVKEGETVKVGSPVFCNKYSPEIKFVSPVSGTIKSIVRGQKRRILDVIISSDSKQESLEPVDVSSENIKETFLNGGLWPMIKQRPIDVVADINKMPKAIFISAFDSSPLAIDYDYSLQNDAENFQKGIDALSKLSSCKIYLTLSSDTPSTSFFNNINGVELNKIDGKHPSGNVGTQIHHISPINKGEIVWTVSPQDVAIIGKYFSTGIYNAEKIIALTGSEVKKPHYCRVIGSCNLSDIISGNYSKDNDVRIISGNALTGIAKKSTGYLGYYHNQITILPEGNNYKFFLTKGWLSPGFGSFSNSRLYPSFLTPNKKYRLDTNTNGEERAFVVTGEMEKVFPFDILPMHLVKAAITKDIDGMENLGIYEVAPEDFALCEFVCTSKINIQEIIREGLDLIAEECM